MSEFVVHSRKGRTADRLDSSVPTERLARDLDYLTPRRVLDPVDRYCDQLVALDPCTVPSNPVGAATYCLPPWLWDADCYASSTDCFEDGLTQDWLALAGAGVVYCNPPYGKVLRSWLEKVALEVSHGAKVLAMLPASRFEQRYFHDLVLSLADAACFVRGRVAFLRPTTGEVAKGNPYASVLWGFNVDVARFGECFAELGRCVRLEGCA